MPICTRDGFEKKPKTPEKFHDNEKVFYCETTKEIFREYEEYFQKVMLVNSTIWACSLTGRENLTYLEALKSERNARKKILSFKDILKAPSLLFVEHAKRSSYKELINLAHHFIKDRYFLGEIINIHKSKHNVIECKILEIIKPDKGPENEVYDPSTIIYKVGKVKTNNESWTTSSETIKRSRFDFTQDTLKLFLKDNTTVVDGIIRAKASVFKKEVSDKNITWKSIFVGKIPQFKANKFVRKNGKDEKKEKYSIKESDNKKEKQATMSEYLVKKNGENTNSANNKVSKAKNIEQAQKFKEEMERIRREQKSKHEELERQRLERVKIIDQEVIKIMLKCDDLHREDQKMLPVYKPVKSIIPIRHFGDFLMIQEFLHSFAPILAAYDVFRNKNVTYHQMFRAFTQREVAGPLSDIFQVLLSTIFSLQIEEERECRVEYIKPKLVNMEPLKSANNATTTHFFVKKYLSQNIKELPIDAQTLSEVLRLHFLSSGAATDEKSERWRYQYRNGYSRTEDPGLLLRMHHPHILRALKIYPVFHLPMVDIIKILNCLINQILTYNGTMTQIEERIEAAAKARNEARLLLAAENKRLQNVIVSQKKTGIEFQTALAECNNDPEKKVELERSMQSKLDEISAADKYAALQFATDLARIKSIIFDHVIYLGSDRAYRQYFIYESIHGIFVEHAADCDDVCLKNPPKNCSELSKCVHEKKAIKMFLSNRYKLADKENLSNQNIGKEVINNHENSLSAHNDNGEVKKSNGAITPLKNGIIKTELTQYDLYMCTGDPTHCRVHDPKNKDRVRWSYICSEEDLNALIDALNSSGTRESELKAQLVNLKQMICEHIKDCPIEMLSINTDEDLKKVEETIMMETQKKYINSNFGFNIDHDVNEVMYLTLIEQILQFEDDITTGNLGAPQFKNREEWRQNLLNGVYDSQCGELSYGVDENTVFIDPSEGLGDTLDVESEDSADESISSHDSPMLRQRVLNLASALLQIEQSIEQKFLKEPFGIKVLVKDKKENENRLIAGKSKLKLWEVSLMNSTSYAQVFLHLNVLSDAIKWNQSVNQSRCIICRKKSDPEKMLLCDDCNAGTHMYCMNPKLKKVPEGNWYCKRCIVNIEQPVKVGTKKVKQVFSMEDENENLDMNGHNETLTDDEEWKLNSNNKTKKSKKRHRRQRRYNDDTPDESVNETEESDEEEQESGTNGHESEPENNENEEDESELYTCKSCGFNGGELQCIQCEFYFHLECAGVRRIPRGAWTCSSKCKAKEDKKQRNDDTNSSDESDAPLAKRIRNSSKRGSDVLNTENRNSSSRRSRRHEENLPLDSIKLYSLLDEIFKHEDAWPFLRPVTLSEVPDYHDIIKRPMDFARVKSNLNMGEYKTNEEVLSDIELIFRNCDTYNSEGNIVYDAGVSLEKFVVKRCKDLKLPFSTSDMITES